MGYKHHTTFSTVQGKIVLIHPLRNGHDVILEDNVIGGSVDSAI